MVLIEKHNFSNQNFLEALEERKAARKNVTNEFDRALFEKSEKISELTVS